MREATLIRLERNVPADHPALPGHFPGHPVVPAAVLLDEIVCAVRAVPGERRVIGIENAKFLRPIAPGEPFTIELARAGDGALRFNCVAGGTVAVRGLLRYEPCAAPQTDRR